MAFLPFAFMGVMAFLPPEHAIVIFVTPRFHWVVLAVFACLTAARQGIDMAGSLYLLAMPPATLRPTNSESKNIASKDSRGTITINKLKKGFVWLKLVVRSSWYSPEY